MIEINKLDYFVQKWHSKNTMSSHSHYQKNYSKFLYFNLFNII